MSSRIGKFLDLKRVIELEYFTSQLELQNRYILEIKQSSGTKIF